MSKSTISILHTWFYSYRRGQTNMNVSAESRFLSHHLPGHWHVGVYPTTVSRAHWQQLLRDEGKQSRTSEYSKAADSTQKCCKFSKERTASCYDTTPRRSSNLQVRYETGFIMQGCSDALNELNERILQKQPWFPIKKTWQMHFQGFIKYWMYFLHSKEDHIHFNGQILVNMQRSEQHQWI